MGVPRRYGLHSTARAFESNLQSQLVPKAALRLVRRPDERAFVNFGGWRYDQAEDAQACHRLMLEIVRRAAFDWVCLGNKDDERAETWADANTWLFEEGPGHPWWETRQGEGTGHLSFLAICEYLALDVERMRTKIRNMTEADVIAVGRPIEHRDRTGLNVEDYAYVEHLRVELRLGRLASAISDRPHCVSEWFTPRLVEDCLTDEPDYHRLDSYVDRSLDAPSMFPSPDVAELDPKHTRELPLRPRPQSRAMVSEVPHRHPEAPKRRPVGRRRLYSAHR